MTSSEEQTHMIIARGLTKTYGEFKAVDGIDFEVRKGEAFGLLGPNGAGKTTLFNCITRLCGISGGSIVFEGTPAELVFPLMPVSITTPALPLEAAYMSAVAPVRLAWSIGTPRAARVRMVSASPCTQASHSALLPSGLTASRGITFTYIKT